MQRNMHHHDLEIHWLISSHFDHHELETHFGSANVDPLLHHGSSTHKVGTQHSQVFSGGSTCYNNNFSAEQLVI